MIFKIVSLANDAIAKKGKDKIVNATIGSLYDEDGNLVALDTVFNTYNSLDNRTKQNMLQVLVEILTLDNRFIIGSYKIQNLIYVIVLLEHLEDQEQ